MRFLLVTGLLLAQSETAVQESVDTALSRELVTGLLNLDAEQIGEAREAIVSNLGNEPLDINKIYLRSVLATLETAHKRRSEYLARADSASQDELLTLALEIEGILRDLAVAPATLQLASLATNDQSPYDRSSPEFLIAEGARLHTVSVLHSFFNDYGSSLRMSEHARSIILRGLLENSPPSPRFSDNPYEGYDNPWGLWLISLNVQGWMFFTRDSPQGQRLVANWVADDIHQLLKSGRGQDAALIGLRAINSIIDFGGESEAARNQQLEMLQPLASASISALEQGADPAWSLDICASFIDQSHQISSAGPKDLRSTSWTVEYLGWPARISAYLDEVESEQLVSVITELCFGYLAAAEQSNITSYSREIALGHAAAVSGALTLYKNHLHERQPHGAVAASFLSVIWKLTDAGFYDLAEGILTTFEGLRWPDDLGTLNPNMPKSEQFEMTALDIKLMIIDRWLKLHRIDRAESLAVEVLDEFDGFCGILKRIGPQRNFQLGGILETLRETGQSARGLAECQRALAELDETELPDASRADLMSMRHSAVPTASPLNLIFAAEFVERFESSSDQSIKQDVDSVRSSLAMITEALGADVGTGVSATAALMARAEQFKLELDELSTAVQGEQRTHECPNYYELLFPHLETLSALVRREDDLAISLLELIGDSLGALEGRYSRADVLAAYEGAIRCVQICLLTPNSNIGTSTPFERDAAAKLEGILESAIEVSKLHGREAPLAYWLEALQAIGELDQRGSIEALIAGSKEDHRAAINRLDKLIQDPRAEYSGRSSDEARKALQLVRLLLLYHTGETFSPEEQNRVESLTLELLLQMPTEWGLTDERSRVAAVARLSQFRDAVVAIHLNSNLQIAESAARLVLATKSASWLLLDAEMRFLRSAPEAADRNSARADLSGVGLAGVLGRSEGGDGRYAAARVIESLRRVQFELRLGSLPSLALPDLSLDSLSNSLAAMNADEWVAIEYFEFTNYQRGDPYPSVLASQLHLGAVVLSSTGDHQVIALGPASTISHSCKEVRRTIESAANFLLADTTSASATAALERKLAGRLSDLYESVLAPCLGSQPIPSVIYVSPDGPLFDIPFTSLVCGTTEGGGPEYLVERAEVVMMGGLARAISVAPSAQQQDDWPHVAMMYGPPSFEADTQAGEQVSGEFGVAGTTLQRWDSLDHLRPFATSTTSVLAERGVICASLSGPSADRAAIEDWSGQDLLLVLTHGALLDTEGLADQELFELYPMMRSALACAPDEDGERAYISAFDVASLDLEESELVCLVACESGRGQLETGLGTNSLVDAFQLAGARDVVAAQWEIPASESAALFGDFVERCIDGNPRPSEAFTQAQRAAIQRSREKSGSAHPFLWAGLSLWTQGR